MKSYSDDIPNVTKEERERKARESTETNDLVKVNLAMMKKFEAEVQEANQGFNTKFKIIMSIATITLLLTAGVALFVALNQTLT